MRLGVILPMVDRPDPRPDFVAHASLAEAVGFSDIWVIDHVVFPLPMADSVVAASMAAAVTERVQICFGVLQAGLRHPVALAKTLGSLQQQSGGRLVAGLGVGGFHPPEWDALEVSRGDRGARFEEILEVLPRLLEGQAVDHSGRFYKFESPALFVERPAHVPLWIGGRHPQALRRAARFDGFLAMFRSPEGFGRDVEEIRAEAVRLGLPAPAEAGVSLIASVTGTDAEAKRRAAGYVQASYGIPEEAASAKVAGGLSELQDLIDRYRSCGATRIVLYLVDEPSSAWERVSRLST